MSADRPVPGPEDWAAEAEVPAASLVEQVLARLPHGGVVLVNDHAGVEARFANGTLTTNGRRRRRSVTVVVLDPRPEGLAAGVAVAGGVGRGRADQLDQLVATALARAAEAPPAEDAAELVAGPSDPGLEEPPEETGPEVLAPLLADLGPALAEAEARGLVLSGYLEHTVDTLVLGTSAGARRRFAQPTGTAQVVGRTADGQASSWVGRGAEDLRTLDLPGMLAEIDRRLRWAARRVELPAGRYPTVLPPDAVADLVCLLGEAAVAQDAVEGRSVFSAPGGGTRLGEQLTPLPFTLRSDPAEPGLACAPFVATSASGPDVSVFDNGLPLGPTAWLEAGTLRRLRAHRAGAARLGLPVSPPVDNLVLELPGAEGITEDLVRGLDRGLLLTCLWYIREVDPQTLLLTGLTRDGVYLVEGGEVVGAVGNYRFNESPLEILRRAQAVGATRRALSREWHEWFPRTAMPPLLVPDFNCSSVSPAT
ncbi:metallopeptidase TldD-related protein [Aciditerrimonas ferrireducens]|uniref:metallopeptidase TldD-related protein n=1 Tax=Aciditerrimonas ferrireducens TaxID=667306 RepID=UPI002005D8DD|nr:metallopeptidase TldD-related protein [Aciditerrimonas ferrireducens]MCK4177542.1 metallopeptidase TldD-related protein [Aciditerrimonas ferrireducens]